MVAYTYKCTCGFDVELVHSIKEDPCPICAECEGPMKRVIYPAPALFRGGGWASDKYHKENT